MKLIKSIRYFALIFVINKILDKKIKASGNSWKKRHGEKKKFTFVI